MVGLTDTYEHHVNSKWKGRDRAAPADPAEAILGFRRLYRRAAGHRFKGPVVITSGRRDSWGRYGTFYVNPERPWHDMIHMVSHYVGNRKFRGVARGHSFQHALLEADLTDYVLASGWLDGALRKNRRAPKAPVPLIDRRYAQRAARLLAWQRKLRRAKTAVAQLERAQRSADRRRALTQTTEPACPTPPPG